MKRNNQPTLIKGALLGALVTLIITQLINLLTEDAYIGIKNFFRMPEQLSDVHKEMQLLTEDIGNVQNNLDDLSGKVNVLADKHDEEITLIVYYLFIKKNKNNSWRIYYEKTISKEYLNDGNNFYFIY